jgi:uncharacterized radical SAM superfamily protein
MDLSTGVQTLTHSSKQESSLQSWFTTSRSELDELFNQAQHVTKQVFNRQITIYNPGSQFPAISITGKHCQLNCQHCGGYFLHQMIPILHPNDLMKFCQNLAQRDGVGCLISGGCDLDGTVPLTPFLSTLKKIKQTTKLFLNVHTGFLNYRNAKLLAETGIDCASVDIIGDISTLHEIYGLSQRSIEDYIMTLKALQQYQIPVTPHICVGLHQGQLKGELAALELIKSILLPQVLVIIAFMPTQGTSMAAIPPANPFDIAKVCALTRLLFPRSEIALGCMRPRGAVRRKTELLAIQAGITRLVLPTKNTLQYLRDNNYKIQAKNACCVM